MGAGVSGDRKAAWKGRHRGHMSVGVQWSSSREHAVVPEGSKSMSDLSLDGNERSSLHINFESMEITSPAHKEALKAMAGSAERTDALLGQSEVKIDMRDLTFGDEVGQGCLPRFSRACTEGNR